MDRARAMEPPLRVVIVDDHEVVRAGLRAELQKHRIDVVGEAGDVTTAVAEVNRAHPDVLVLDVRLPGGGAAAVLTALGDRAPPTLAVSASDERDDVILTIRAGADGYMLKTAAVAAIANGIREIGAGRPFFSAELAGHLLEVDRGDAVQDPTWEALTAREREVLRVLARGHPYKRIADDLGVGVKTVETHVRNILRKLQVTTRHEATRWAAERGFDQG